MKILSLIDFSMSKKINNEVKLFVFKSNEILEVPNDLEYLVKERKNEFKLVDEVVKPVETIEPVEEIKELFEEPKVNPIPEIKKVRFKNK